MLHAIKQDAPCGLYHLHELPDKKPIVLSDADIRLLVEFALLYKPKVTLHPSRKTIDLLTLLISIGTELPLNKDNVDKYLGRKDNRIETYIIEQAIQRVEATGFGVANTVVFGLSGNPPTINHLIYIQHLMMVYDTVHLILNAQSPLKDSTNYLDAETRLEMLQTMLTAEHVDSVRCKLERLEIDRDPPSRMIATISLLLLNSNLNQRVTLALGLDALPDFSQWYKWSQYGALCDIKFYPRQGVTIDAEQLSTALAELLNNKMNVTLVYHSEEQKKAYELIAIPLDKKRLALSEEIIPTFQGSSTELRDYYGPENADNTQIPPNIHPVVDQLIRARGLYGYRSGR